MKQPGKHCRDDCFYRRGEGESFPLFSFQWLSMKTETIFYSVLTNFTALIRLKAVFPSGGTFIITELYVFFVIFLSSFLQTTTGFGYAIITAPLLALVLGAKLTVMLVMVTALIICIFLLRATRNQGSFKAIAPLITASVIGAIPGAFVMTQISNDGLKLFMGVFLLLATLALWKNHTFPVKPGKAVEVTVGFISGFLTTTTAITGPPVILYFLNAKAERNKVEFRANLTRFFLLVNIASIFFSFVAGTLNISELWLYTLIAIPAIYAGFYLGEKMFYRISVPLLRKGSLLMILLSSVAIILSVLGKAN